MKALPRVSRTTPGDAATPPPDGLAQEAGGPAAIAASLSRLFAPSRFSVEATGGDPTALLEPGRLRSLRTVMIRVDRPLTLTVAAALGPVLAVPVGFGLAPEAITRPASATSRQRALVVPAGGAATRQFAATEVVVLLDAPQGVLELEATAILGRALTHAVEFGPTVDLTAATGRRLEAALELLLAQLRLQSPLLSSDLAERRLEQVVLDMFLLAADHIEEEMVGDDGATIATPWVQHAIQLLESSPGARWSVTRLSQQVAVSPRALHHGFRRDLGTTPMGFLLELRLSLAYEEFARRPVDVTVAEVANALGLPHPGRFASAYRTRFGEAPSQTLRR